jgi:hypothetical protein
VGAEKIFTGDAFTTAFKFDMRTTVNVLVESGREGKKSMQILKHALAVFMSNNIEHVGTKSTERKKAHKIGKGKC